MADRQFDSRPAAAAGLPARTRADRRARTQRLAVAELHHGAVRVHHAAIVADRPGLLLGRPEQSPFGLGALGDRVAYAETNYAALDGADALVIVTDWNEYRHPDLKRIKATLKRPIVVDGRNLYDPAKMRSLGFTYLSIGRSEA